MPPLSATLTSASFLLEPGRSNERPSDLPSVLIARLQKYQEATGTLISVNETSPVAAIQIETAGHLLSVLEACQRILLEAPEAGIGTKDFSILQTAISVIFNWGGKQLYNLANPFWRGSPGPVHQLEDITRLSQFLRRLLLLVLPSQGTELQTTFITNILLSKYPSELLLYSFALGWSPEPWGSIEELDYFQSSATKLLIILPPSEAISALGKVLSTKPFAHVHQICSKSMSQQLLRTGGVRGLLEVIFGDPGSEGSEAPALPKLQQTARVLSALPSDTTPEEYYRQIIPRVFSLVSTSSPGIFRTAAAFTISRMLTSPSRHQSVISPLIYSYLHSPWTKTSEGPRLNDDDNDDEAEVSEADTNFAQSPRDSLTTLTLLLANMNPSPTLVSSILSPIIPPLYCLWAHTQQIRTSDPELRDNLTSILATWGRIVSMEEATNVLWVIVQGEGGYWTVSMVGEIRRTNEPSPEESLNILTPEDVKRAADSEDSEMDTNFLNLRPDPAVFVKFLLSLQQSDLSVAILIRLLQAYRETKSSTDSNPLRSLVYLQILVRLQNNLVEQKMASKVLRQPQQIVSFVREVVDSSTLQHQDHTTHLERTKTSSFKIVDDEDEPKPEILSDLPDAEEEILATALNLLLSILEANQDLSARTFPELNEVFTSLEPLTQHSSDIIARLAREVRLVMTARLASSSSATGSRRHPTKEDEDDQQETYHKALKLLQDPILPVRAHGLLLLRQLVSSSRKRKVDEALVPAILSIFLQSVQDDDPYIFLNAVQGLSAMVDMYGSRILSGLVRDYAGGLQGHGAANLSQSDLDVRLRIGEALGQVISRYGEALGVYVDVLVPPIAALLRNSEVPTALRTSAISILNQCIETHALSLAQYTADLANAMVDLVRIESVQAPIRTKKDHPPLEKSKQDEQIETVPDPEPPETMDNQPTSKNSQLPPLRRAALRLLSSLIAEVTKHLYDSPHAIEHLPDWVLQRIQTTLRYVAATDVDPVVKLMAREGLEQLQQLNEARVGL